VVFLNLRFRASEIRSEIFCLLLFIGCGMMLLVSADSLLMVFMALELLSLPTYVLVGIHRRDKASSEAALKYFLFGSFATVLLVFGITLLYGQFGTLLIPKIATMMRGQNLEGPVSKAMVYGGLALLMIAIAFKVGVAPFHMWVPDVYQGAPSPVTGFMGSAIKLAGFGLAIRILWGMFLPLADQWSGVLATLAVIAMFVGNVAALAQDNLKRIFAYSSIAHAGYLLLGISAVGTGAPSINSIGYYLVVYGLMFLGLFAIITLIERQTRSTDIYQLSGMGFTHPLLALCLALFALSGAGIPPTAGFFAKYFVFLDAVREGKTYFVVLGLISSLIGVYYYLRILVYLYMKESRERLAMEKVGPLAYLGILTCAFAMLFFAVSPNSLNLPASSAANAPSAVGR
jgi:NADH-quinone oxidoreductase subunit N